MTILILLVFVGGQSHGSFYSVPSMSECQAKRADLLKEIASTPEVDRHFVGCVVPGGKA